MQTSLLPKKLRDLLLSKGPASVASLMLMSAAALALEPLDEEALSSINAQDGLTLEVSSNTPITTTKVNWVTDGGSPATATPCTTGGVANRQACTTTNPALSGVGGPLNIKATLDAFGGPSGPGLALQLDWQPLLLQTKAFTLTTPTANYDTNTLGNFGIYSQGHLYLSNQGGIFNSSGNTATLDFTSTGDIIYRQGTGTRPELSFGNFTLNNRFTNGAVGGQTASTGMIGLDATGLIVSAPFVSSNLIFDLMFKAAATTEFERTGRSPMLRFGWEGGLKDPFFRLAAGGVGYGTHVTGSNTYYDYTEAAGRTPSAGGAPRSEGLNILAQWDFDSDFIWRLGQSGGNATTAKFGKWRALGSASSPMLSMPVTLDALQNNVGPAGLCFGGGFSSGSPVQASCTSITTTPSGTPGVWVPSTVPAGKAALAVLIRDGHLHAYNQQLQIVEGATSIAPYNWSLLFTMGKLDSDIYLYPEGRDKGIAAVANSNGLKADINLLIQSPGYWDQANSSSAATRAALYTTGAGSRWATNSHFMIVDTSVGNPAGGGPQLGIGLMNADLQWSVKDMYFRLVDTDTGGYTGIPGGLWMQTDTQANFHFRGLFGSGGDITKPFLDLSKPAGIALVDVNLSTNRFIFALSPTMIDAYNNMPIGFTGLLDLNSASYISFGEISSPASAFKLSNMSGRIGWKNGTVSLLSGTNGASDGKPSVSIRNDLVFGSSASFGPADIAPKELIANVGFGTESFGRIVLPGGIWNSDVSLKIPNN